MTTDETKKYIDGIVDREAQKSASRYTNETDAEMLQRVATREDESDIAMLLKTAHAVIQKRDAKAIEAFQKFLTAADDRYIQKIDHAAVAWFVSHGTKENFEMLNDFRAFYGLQTYMEPYKPADPAQTIARRIRFAGRIQTSTKDNPHYQRQHSETFKAFRPDYRKRYQSQDYDLSHSPILAVWQKEGVRIPQERIQKALARFRFPPEQVGALNAYDLAHVIAASEKDGRGAARMAAERTNDSFSVPSIREKHWKETMKQPEIVAFLAENMLRSGVEPDEVKTFLLNAAEKGNPLCYNGDWTSDRRVTGLSVQIHHNDALREGGENKAENFVYTYENYRDSDIALNSHAPLHEYDNPLVNVALDSDGFLHVSSYDQPIEEGCKRMTLLTHPVSSNLDETKGEHIIGYMGTTADACLIRAADNTYHRGEFDPLKIRDQYKAREKNQTLQTDVSQNKAPTIRFDIGERQYA